MTNADFVLHFGAAWLVVIVCARFVGVIARMVGQSAVIGEMISGILLGPSVLGWILPGIGDYLFGEIRQSIYGIGMVGLCLYMFLVGVEHRAYSDNRGSVVLPVALGIGGVALPLVVGGIAALFILPEFRPDNVTQLAFATFVGGALSVTAFPMLARFLQERNMVGTRFGIVATRSAAIDDVLAWCILALSISLLSRQGGFAVLRTVSLASLFAVAFFVVMPKIYRRWMMKAAEEGGISDTFLVALLATVLGAGWFTDLIGVYSVFGGFVVGVSLPKVRGFYEILASKLLPIVRCFFLPLFFAYSGLSTNFRVFNKTLLFTASLLFLVALLSKMLVGALLTRCFGWPWREAFAIGSLMNARGLMILIFINVGLETGALTSETFSMLVVVALMTTALATPLYRYFLPEFIEDSMRKNMAEVDE